MPDTPAYQQKKALFDGMLTVYGRKAVLETLRDKSLNCHALHVASSNREGGIVREIKALAEQLELPIKEHSREALSRLSKNGKQDQGVALDVICPAFRTLDDYLKESCEQPARRLLALDGISNPQNLGMIIRSAAAGNIDGIVIAQAGNAALGPLVIKASAGTVYRAPLLRCDTLPSALASCRDHGAKICSLQANASESLFEYAGAPFSVFVLGNETQGVSAQAQALADTHLSIPMRNGVESLNVAITASLIAFGTYLER
ncbi:MAG: 23S rRNA (guanosine2251-2'-O)-methyltransferase [Halioglobus sp.]|jgi:23S rRNA (guanosine2251-2'-O)-methyltransferase